MFLRAQGIDDGDSGVGKGRQYQGLSDNDGGREIDNVSKGLETTTEAAKIQGH